MSKHGAEFPRRLTWEWEKNRYYYYVPNDVNKFLIMFEYKVSFLHAHKLL